MQQPLFNSTSRFVLIVVSLFISSLLRAQTTVSNTTASDEQTIRNLVAQQNEGKQIPFSDDRIFVSGAYPRPIIGKEMSAENKNADERMKTERQNFTRKDRIERLVLSQAGDMAYEFGYGDLAWDTPDKKHVAFEASYVRVWRKLQGQWKVDLFFARPNESISPKLQ
jgi:ketosteroid isomerase-like protein